MNTVSRTEQTFRLCGRLRVIVRSARAGGVVAEHEADNLVVDAGLDLVRDLLAGASSSDVTHLGVGTGATAAAAGDTALGAEVARGQLTERITTTAGEVTFRYYLPSGTANGNTLQEAGLFTASSGGTMLARVVHASVVKTSSVAVTYEWTITLSAS